jgi:hypothetical protein
MVGECARQEENLQNNRKEQLVHNCGLLNPQLGLSRCVLIGQSIPVIT